MQEIITAVCSYIFNSTSFLNSFVHILIMLWNTQSLFLLHLLAQILRLYSEMITFKDSAPIGWLRKGKRVVASVIERVRFYIMQSLHCWPRRFPQSSAPG